MNDLPEMEWLERQAEDLYNKEGRDLRILEIGSFHCQSTSLLAQFGTVLSIDLFADLHDGMAHYDNIGQGHFVDFIKNVIRLKLVDRIFPVIATSNYLDSLPNMEFDLIFIDASHKYVETKKDIEKSIRHLGRDKLLIIHDYCRPGWGYPGGDPNNPNYTTDPNKDPWWGVKKAIDEFIEMGEFGISEHYLGIVELKRVEYITEVKKTIQ